MHMTDDETTDETTATPAGSEAVKGIRADRVERWLLDNIDGAIAPFTFEAITGGHSNLTFRVTGGDGRNLVLRRPPLGSVLATAHDMSREHRIISAIAKTDVPVPAALGLCTDESINDAPFYIMDFVDGVVFADEETAEAELPAPEQRAAASRSVVEVLASLHTADPDMIGLGDLGRKESYIDRQLKRWSGQWEKSKTRELPVMEEAYRRLLTGKPEQRYTGIVHGDYRLGNMLVDPATGSIAAVLDWELCTLGDVLADIGYLLNNWVQPGEETFRGATAFPTHAGGFSSREALVERYCDLTGFDVDHINSSVNYYRAFQSWRLGAIVEGVLARYLKGVMVDDSVDTDDYKIQVEQLAEDAVALL